MSNQNIKIPQNVEYASKKVLDPVHNLQIFRFIKTETG